MKYMIVSLLILMGASSIAQEFSTSSISKNTMNYTDIPAQHMPIRSRRSVASFIRINHVSVMHLYKKLPDHSCPLRPPIAKL